jgi:two-component system chemotaxis response regulator CheB
LAVLEAIELTEKLKPNIITMDITMPVMDGLEATRQIMSRFPTPIVVISSTIGNEEVNTTLLALEAGALSVMVKPYDITSPHFNETKKNMLAIIRAMSEIKPIKKREFLKNSHREIHKPPIFKIRKYEILALGASVGGPQVLKKILTALPADFPLPILVVQHITVGFIEGFTHWLNDYSLLRVKTAVDHEVLLKNTVYFAPDNFHLEVGRDVEGKLIAVLTKSAPVSGFCPSITVLLKSVAKICGDKGVGAIFTGMGSDGAEGLLALKKAQGHTLIQDEKSSVVFGMAGVAQALGAVDSVVELDEFVGYLMQITKSGFV